MTPKIKSIEITEVANLDPAAYQPGDPEDFSCTFGLTIGPADSDGGEQFYISVCSPKWLQRACADRGFIWGRNHLVVPSYDLAMIRNVIGKFVQNCSGASWNEVASKLSRIAAWEFDDYQA